MAGSMGRDSDVVQVPLNNARPNINQGKPRKESLYCKNNRRLQYGTSHKDYPSMLVGEAHFLGYPMGLAHGINKVAAQGLPANPGSKTC